MILDQIQSSSFLDLVDTPSTYSGSAGKVVTVNSGSNGLEFTTATSGSSGFISYNYIQERGGTEFATGWKTFYICNCNGATGYNATTETMAKDFMYAVPFIVPAGGTIDDIRGSCNAAKPGKYIRAGIYESNYHNDRKLYPTNLIADCGTAELLVGWLTVSGLSVVVQPGILYWMAFICEDAFNSNVILNTSATPILGYDYNTSTHYQYPYNHISVAKTYGALPVTFPVGALARGGVGTHCPYRAFSLSA